MFILDETRSPQRCGPFNGEAAEYSSAHIAPTFIRRNLLLLITLNTKFVSTFHESSS